MEIHPRENGLLQVHRQKGVPDLVKVSVNENAFIPLVDNKVHPAWLIRKNIIERAVHLFPLDK